MNRIATCFRLKSLPSKVAEIDCIIDLFIICFIQNKVYRFFFLQRFVVSLPYLRESIFFIFVYLSLYFSFPLCLVRVIEVRLIFFIFILGVFGE